MIQRTIFSMFQNNSSIIAEESNNKSWDNSNNDSLKYEEFTLDLIKELDFKDTSFLVPFYDKSEKIVSMIIQTLPKCTVDYYLTTEVNCLDNPPIYTNEVLIIDLTFIVSEDFHLFRTHIENLAYDIILQEPIKALFIVPIKNLDGTFVLNPEVFRDIFTDKYFTFNSRNIIHPEYRCKAFLFQIEKQDRFFL